MIGGPKATERSEDANKSMFSGEEHPNKFIKNLKYSNISYDETSNNRMTANELDYRPVRMSQIPYDDNMLNREELQIFQLLSEKDNEQKLQNLLENISFKILINLRNTTGYSALHVACCNNHSKYV